MIRTHFWLINIVGFQFAWWSAALLQQHALPILLLLIVFHFLYSPSKKIDLKICAVVVTIGLTLDVLLINLGLFSLSSESLLTSLWYGLLWLCFATTFNHSMKWLGQIPALAVFLIGGVFGPLSYYAAFKLNAFSYFTLNIEFLLIHGVAWGVLMVIVANWVTLLNEHNKVDTLAIK